MRNLLHYTSAAYLLVLMLVKMMGMQIAVLDYRLHRDFIAANLCENRAVPKMMCAGKCYLKKQLNRANESSESQEEKGTAKSFSVDFFENAEPPRFIQVLSSLVHDTQFLITRLLHPFISSIFHPPLFPAI